MRLSFLGDRTKTSYAQLVVQFYSRSVVSLFSHVVNLLTFSFTDFAIKRIASATVRALFRNDCNHFMSSLYWPVTPLPLRKNRRRKEGGLYTGYLFITLISNCHISK